MKKILTAIAISLLCITTFAQGKVSFQNDSLRLVYWGPSAGGFFGQAVNSDNLVPGLSGMVADLYLGTSSSQLTLFATTIFRALASGPGRWNITSVTAAGIPSGTVFVQVAVHSTEKPSLTTFDAAALETYQAHGSSVEFSFTLGTGIVYPVLWGANSTWPPGDFNMDQYGVGSRGAIRVEVIPEPSILALAGLGGAAMLTFHRRKQSQLTSGHFCNYVMMGPAAVHGDGCRSD